MSRHHEGRLYHCAHLASTAEKLSSGFGRSASRWEATSVASDTHRFTPLKRGLNCIAALAHSRQTSSQTFFPTGSRYTDFTTTFLNRNLKYLSTNFPPSTIKRFDDETSRTYGKKKNRRIYIFSTDSTLIQN